MVPQKAYEDRALISTRSHRRKPGSPGGEDALTKQMAGLGFKPRSVLLFPPEHMLPPCRALGVYGTLAHC